jgi:hypothetical protein
VSRKANHLAAAVSGRVARRPLRRCVPDVMLNVAGYLSAGWVEVLAAAAIDEPLDRAPHVDGGHRARAERVGALFEHVRR